MDYLSIRAYTVQYGISGSCDGGLATVCEVSVIESRRGRCHRLQFIHRLVQLVEQNFQWSLLVFHLVWLFPVHGNYMVRVE
jgi:hypothetical protein